MSAVRTFRRLLDSGDVLRIGSGGYAHCDVVSYDISDDSVTLTAKITHSSNGWVERFGRWIGDGVAELEFAIKPTAKLPAVSVQVISLGVWERIKARR
jgi:hypothetical protein